MKSSRQSAVTLRADHRSDSEGSHLMDTQRSFAALRMTWVFNSTNFVKAPKNIERLWS